MGLKELESYFDKLGFTIVQPDDEGRVSLAEVRAVAHTRGMCLDCFRWVRDVNTLQAVTTAGAVYLRGAMLYLSSGLTRVEKKHDDDCLTTVHFIVDSVPMPEQLPTMEGYAEAVTDFSEYWHEQMAKRMGLQPK